MKFKKIILMLTVFTCVLAIAGLGFAANRVEVKVTSEPVPELSACDKGGGFSLAFDANTELVVGDIITIDLDYTSAASNVSLCKTFDLEISPGGNGLLWSSAANIPDVDLNPTAVSPVYMRSTGALAASIAPTTLGGVSFRLQGTAGTQRITLYVMGTAGNKLVVGPDTELVIQFLDQKTNTDFSNDGIWVLSAAGTFTTAASRSDNTLCINVSKWANPKVKGSMDSKDDKFTFIPSDPQIAHIIAGLTYAVKTCKTANCGSISIPTSTTQTSTCGFDNETGTGYCLTGRPVSNHITIEGKFDSNDDYYIEASIKVNAVEYVDKGVYFSNGTLGVASSTVDPSCTLPATAALAPATYKLANKTTTTLSGATSCVVKASDRAVYLKTPSFKVATGSFMAVDLPSFVFDSTVIKEGDKVEVVLTLSKAPCGTLLTATHCIGTFGCASATTTQTLVFPYFTQMGTSDDNYWDGFVVTNLSAKDGTAKLTIYEMDGDVATMSVPVAANGIYVDLLSNMMADMTLTKSVNGTLGNARAYIVVCADFTCDGFAMMGEPSGTSMGYLPRNSLNVVSGLCK